MDISGDRKLSKQEFIEGYRSISMDQSLNFLCYRCKNDPVIRNLLAPDVWSIFKFFSWTIHDHLFYLTCIEFLIIKKRILQEQSPFAYSSDTSWNRISAPLYSIISFQLNCLLIFLVYPFYAIIVFLSLLADIALSNLSAVNTLQINLKSNNFKFDS